MAKNLAAFDGSKTYLNMSAASRSGKTPAPCVSSGMSCGSTSLLVTPFSADARGDDPGEKGQCIYRRFWHLVQSICVANSILDGPRKIFGRFVNNR